MQAARSETCCEVGPSGRSHGPFSPPTSDLRVWAASRTVPHIYESAPGIGLAATGKPKDPHDQVRVKTHELQHPLVRRKARLSTDCPPLTVSKVRA